MPSTTRTAAAMLSVAAAVVSATACTTTVPGEPVSTPTGFVMTLDHSSVEVGVRQVVTQYDPESAIESVVCPDGVPVKVGTTFECAITLDGRETTVTVLIKTEDGMYEVGRPK